MEENLKVIERVRQALNVRNDSELANVLGITPQSVSNYKKDGFSRLKLKEIADRTGKSLSFLQYGVEIQSNLTMAEKQGKDTSGGERSVQMSSNGDKPKPCETCKNHILIEWIKEKHLVDIDKIKESDEFLKFAGKILFSGGK